MKLLSNRIGGFLTGGDIADAVQIYGLALEREQAVDLVEIPYRNGGGSTQRVRMTVGWMHELITATTPTGADEEMIDPSVVDDLQRRTAALGAPGLPLQPHEVWFVPDDF